MSQLAGSKGIDALGGLVTIYSEPNTLTRNEIKDYLNNLKIILDKNHTPNNHIGIVLGNIEHTMGLSYNLKTQHWTFVNSNQWPPTSTTNLNRIATKIMEGFNPDYTAPYISFDTTIICPAKQQNELLHTKLLTFRSLNLMQLPQNINERLTKEKLITIAALFGHLDYVNALLTNSDKKASIDDKSIALTIAIQEGYFEIAKLLLDHDANPNFKHGNFKITPLHMAIRKSSPRLTALLLQKGADPDLAVDQDTPLARAAIKGNIDIIRCLISHNANPNIKNLRGYTALGIAEYYDHSDAQACLSEWVVKFNDFFHQMSIAIEISVDHETIIALIHQLQRSNSALNRTAQHGLFAPLRQAASPPAKRVKLTHDPDPLPDCDGPGMHH